MSSASLKPARSSKLGQGRTSTQSSQSLLLEKVNARTSTPDSEALASSEDESDLRVDAPQASAVQPPKPARRSSWLNDTSQPISRLRKESFASSSMSPTTSHPSTPSAEAVSGPWASHNTSSVVGRPAGPTTFAWGKGIWNDRKDAPPRLSEVFPSPTSTAPPGAVSNSFFTADVGLTQASSVSRDPGPNSQIPFAIPLHPTPKAYRSQSYSVGQKDFENVPQTTINTPGAIGRGRHPGLQHYPSRPSMLSELAKDTSVLSKVKEVDGDDESPTGSFQDSFHQTSESKAIEILTRENAILRQQQQQQQQHQQQYNNRIIRPRAPTGTAYLGNGFSLQESVPEESDFAVDELNESNESAEHFGTRFGGWRMSEYGGTSTRSLGVDSRKLDMNLKKALWSSSPSFFAGDISQSRRHSFANMPTRQGSISSNADSVSTLNGNATDGQASQGLANFTDGQGFPSSKNPSAAFFPGGHSTMQGAFNVPYPSAFGLPDHQFSLRASSPHRNMYGMGQPRYNQLLHVVLFKCARADVFYIQEGTGLTFKPGDLVIVEADRGTDLGTVAKDNVDWQKAKELKEHYAEEHYKWLMYSQGAAAQEGSGSGPLASTGGFHGSTVSGLGPSSQHHLQEPTAGDLRPKLIKRLAQSHEVHSLRDKEGQEAKAKRVCMQKVKEHVLNMEILDAEFQMDWKKLTFYYFADSYINFNSLVTDLFKIYKTRIWMSAINPASFASPTLGIQAPSGIGPGAVGVGRASSGADRRQNQQAQDQQSQAFAHASQAAARGFRAFGGERQMPTAAGFATSNYAYGSGGAFGNARGGASYLPSLSPGLDIYSQAGYQQPGDFQSIRQRLLPSESLPDSSSHQGLTPLSSQNDWATTFQGLSLNTQ